MDKNGARSQEKRKQKDNVYDSNDPLSSLLSIFGLSKNFVFAFNFV